MGFGKRRTHVPSNCDRQIIYDQSIGQGLHLQAVTFQLGPMFSR